MDAKQGRLQPFPCSLCHSPLYHSESNGSLYFPIAMHFAQLPQHSPVCWLCSSDQSRYCGPSAHSLHCRVFGLARPALPQPVARLIIRVMQSHPPPLLYANMDWPRCDLWCFFTLELSFLTRQKSKSAILVEQILHP